MEENSSTGIYLINRKSPIQAVTFTDLTCPGCGNTLHLDVRRLGGVDYPIRYVCYSCGFICPIKHGDSGNNTPTYGREVYDFLSNFGEDIKDRIAKGRDNIEQSYYDDGGTLGKNKKDKRKH